MTPVEYFRGDELPAYQRPVTINGEAPDLSTGWTFTLTLRRNGLTTLTKTSGITGDDEGTLTATWATGELNIVEGLYDLQVTARRTLDSREWTFDDQLLIKQRTKAEA